MEPNETSCLVESNNIAIDEKEEPQTTREKDKSKEIVPITTPIPAIQSQEGASEHWSEAKGTQMMMRTLEMKSLKRGLTRWSIQDVPKILAGELNEVPACNTPKSPLNYTRDFQQKIVGKWHQGNTMSHRKYRPSNQLAVDNGHWISSSELPKFSLVPMRELYGPLFNYT
ncbi:hypothetical protein HAX54_005868, partial [Datura stramonium]|nr:hypothetical protein [Datura stramonium]